MKKQKHTDECFNAIMQLQGAENYKEEIQRLLHFQQNKNKDSLFGVKLVPNYTFITKRGGGTTTAVKIFADFLHTNKLFEFKGNSKYFEHKLSYISPASGTTQAFLSELIRLDHTISKNAGFNRYYKGVACINIDGWIHRTHEENFQLFLNYISNKNDKMLTILHVNVNDERESSQVESSLLSHLGFEPITFRFPNPDELVDGILTTRLQQRGYTLKEDAKELLTESIAKMINGKNFYGFRSIEQLSDKIARNLLVSNISCKEISAAMLKDFDKESKYVKCIVTTSNEIGFNK
jgi:hypothetical protein